MAITRPYAFNTGSTIDGTIQVGNIAIGVDALDYSTNPGGVKWWMGPDEELGYVMTSSDNFPQRESKFGFHRSNGYNVETALSTINEVAGIKGQSSFTGLTDAINWMVLSGYPITPSLDITFDSISNVPVISPTNVSNWNTFFDLPTNGSPFTFVIVDGNTVKLYGGSGITIKANLFQNNRHLISIYDNAECVVKLGDQAFLCTSATADILTSVSFPACVQTVSPSTITSNGTFGNRIALRNINMPSCNIIGMATFYWCLSLSACTLNYNSITGLTHYTFYGTKITEFSSTSLTFLGRQSLGYCVSLKTVNLPALTTMEDLIFETSTGITYLNLPSVTTLGKSTGLSDIFNCIHNNTIYLNVPSALMTCNDGYPDADIMFLAANNRVIINGSLYLPFPEYSGNLVITFDSASHMPVADPSSVSDWNTFFDHPYPSTPFTSVNVGGTGNTITLIGGKNIVIRPRLFYLNTYITSFIDEGCIVVTNSHALGRLNSCTSMELPSLRIAGWSSFYINPLLTTLNFPLLKYAGLWCFNGCSNVTSIDIPLLVSANDHCFRGCTKVTTFDFPLLTLAQSSCFRGNTSGTTYNLPSLQYLGNTTGNDSVFGEITGKAITITIPPSLASDGDITYLETNNTVTRINPTANFTLSSQGTGAGVATLAFESSSETTIEVDGNARFYDDDAGTINPTTGRTINPGSMNYFYVKVPSGVSNFKINTPENIIKWGDPDYENGWASYIDGFYSPDENSPILGGKFTALPNITHASLYNYITYINNLNINVDYDWGTVPRKLVQFELGSDGIGTGRPEDMPRNLKYIYMFCDNDGTGNLDYMPPSMEYYFNMVYWGYVNPTFTGTLLGLPSTLIRFATNGYENIAGDFGDVREGMRGLLLGSVADTNGGDISDLPSTITQFTYYGISEIHYTSGHTWNDSVNYIKIKPSLYGLTIHEQTGLIIDISNAAWDWGPSYNYFYLRGTGTASLIDTNQGGIWGDFTNTPAPTALATALKNLNTKINSASILLQDAVVPGITGDGTGFPAGFGNWWRS